MNVLAARRGMKSPFVAEVELAPPVERWLAQLGSLITAPEVEGDYGIADLVAGFGDARKLLNRRRQAPPVATSQQLDLLEYCSPWRSESELRAWAPHGWSAMQSRVIDPLRAAGLLRTDGSRFRSVAVPKDPFDMVIAVELKLRDARRGLEQANSYRLFADASYLAMPDGRFTDEIIKAASRCGVGLLIVSRQDVNMILAPQGLSSPSSRRRRLVSEKLLRHEIHGSGRLAGSPIYMANA